MTPFLRASTVVGTLLIVGLRLLHLQFNAILSCMNEQNTMEFASFSVPTTAATAEEIEVKAEEDDTTQTTKTTTTTATVTTTIENNDEAKVINNLFASARKKKGNIHQEVYLFWGAVIKKLIDTYP